MTAERPIVLALGGEGSPEERGAIQVNLPRILNRNFVCASDGSSRLERLKRAGPVIVSDSFELPFAGGSFDKIIARNIPICQGGCEKLGGPEVCNKPPTTNLGKVYCAKRVKRLLKEGGVLKVSNECWLHNF